jgi:hypothetical protein
MSRRATPGWGPSSRPVHEDEWAMRRHSTGDLWKVDGEMTVVAYWTISGQRKGRLGQDVTAFI